MGNKVLYVDDEAVWGLTVGTFLRLAGYQVVTARDGKEAMLQAGQGSLGAIILDVNLPGEDTAQIMRDLKAKQSDARMILYTGLERNEEAVQRLLKEGAANYLRKGNLKDLLKCLLDISEKSGSNERGPRFATAGAWQVV